MLLNLIIAIVSETFNEFYAEKPVKDRQVKLDLILEIDHFLYFGSSKGKFDPKSFRKYGQMFKMIVKNQDTVEGIENKIQDARKDIQEVKGEVMEKIKGVEGKIDLIIKKLNIN